MASAGNEWKVTAKTAAQSADAAQRKEHPRKR
jgi:hypothetical protein